MTSEIPGLKDTPPDDIIESAYLAWLGQAYLAWLSQYARENARENELLPVPDLQEAFLAGAAAERLKLSRDIGLAAARLRDMATALDSQEWPGREHLAGSSFLATCWCQIAHTAAQASELNEAGPL